MTIDPTSNLQTELRRGVYYGQSPRPLMEKAADEIDRLIQNDGAMQRRLTEVLADNEQLRAELADRDTVPRSRYDACNRDWLEAKAERDRATALVGELAALVPLSETIAATRTGATLVQWFKDRLSRLSAPETGQSAQLVELYNAIAGCEKLSAYAPALLRAIRGFPSETKPDETKTRTGQKRWMHVVHCNAGPQTPLGGDMCICLRELSQLAECLSAGRYSSAEETSRKLPPREFDLDTHQGFYAEKAPAYRTTAFTSPFQAGDLPCDHCGWGVAQHESTTLRCRADQYVENGLVKP